MRPARRVAAAAYAARVHPHAEAADRALLTEAAEALLSRPHDTALHTEAYRLLLRDRTTRARHLAAALGHFTGGTGGPGGRGNAPPDGSEALAGVLAGTLATHPEVLDAFRRRLLAGPTDPAVCTGLLSALATVSTPALARRITRLVREYTEHCPLGSPEPVARFVTARLRHGTPARAVLYPLVAGLLREGAPGVRAALGRVLGHGRADPLCAELLDLLLENERDPAVLAEVLTAVATAGPAGTDRDLIHRLGLLMTRTPEGARTFDRRLLDLSRALPAFGTRLTGWLRAGPGDWTALVGTATRRELTRDEPARDERAREDCDRRAAAR
jgi:hypothetical protein